MLKPPTLLVGLLALLLAACGGNEPAEHSALFQHVMGNGKKHLRGVALGDSLLDARAAESRTPTHEDDYGLVFRFPLPETGKLQVEYWRSPTGTPPGIAAININVLLGNEQRARRLFEELNAYFRQRFDLLPGGAYGNYHWQVTSQNLRISLKFENLKKNLTLSASRLGGPSSL